MKIYIPFLGLLMFCLSLKGQKTLGIVSPTPEIKTGEFSILKVTDSTNSPILGEIYNNDQALTVSITESKNQSIFYRLENPEAGGFPVEMVIKENRISETPNDNTLSGELSLAVDYYAVRGRAQKQFLISAYAKQVYNRSVGDVSVKNLNLMLLKNIQQVTGYLDQWIVLNRTTHPAFSSQSQVIILPDYAINHADTVYHVTRPLTWDDFRGKPNNAFSASIFTSIAYTMEMTVENKIITGKITPKVYMVKGISWVKPHAKIDEYLVHEQLHFDITQVVMNRFLDRIKNLNEPTPDDLQSRIQYEYLEAYREMNRFQKAYDRETRHGQNRIKQVEWEAKVKEWLNEI